MRVKIINTPTGEAPEHIRKGWVGCEFEVEETPGGFQASWNEALRSLHKRNPDSAMWHLMKYPVHEEYLHFELDCCEVLQEECGFISGTHGRLAHHPA